MNNQGLLINTPKVSIVIPAYNASNYLAQAIESALAQTYRNIEVIVVNDGSNDGGATEKIALSYGERIRYFYKENGGSSSAINVGIANMTGEWFSWLSHDDLYAPEKVERQIKALVELNIAPEDRYEHIFFSASELIDGQGNKIRRVDEKKEQRLAEEIRAVLHNGYLICEPTKYNFHGCSCLVHKKAFECVGRFREDLRLLNDLDMWFRLYAADFKVHYIPVPLVYGRVHSAQISNSIGYSYHNSEQDMFWSRSLDWLTEHYPLEEELFVRFGKNAYLKTRYVDGECAFGQTNLPGVRKSAMKCAYRLCAEGRCLAKKLYLKVKA